MKRELGMSHTGTGARGFARRHWQAALMAASLTAVTFAAQANPQGGHVVAGTGNISAPNANLTVVNQKSSGLVINWNSFNIGKGQTVKFVQPGASAAALNRIFDLNPSQIFGNLLANGQVFLLNSNGIVFGRDSFVNVSALFATSLGISDSDFMAGKFDFSAPAGQDGGAIVNHGTLQALTG